MAAFKPGQSGNPKGKPKGARNKTTLACEKLLDGEGETLTRKAIELAKGGDLIALRICLDRIVPLRKGRLVTFALPAINDVADIPPAVGAILQAVADGELTPDEGASIGAVVDQLRRAHELDDLADRIAALEAARSEATQ